jgi:hypothetical protein
MDRTVNAQLAALHRARRAVLIAHTVKTLFALLVLGDFWLELVGVASGGDLVGVVRHFLQRGPWHVEAASWALCAYLVAGPALTQYVLASLAQREQPAAAALRRYGRALGLSALRLAGFGIAAAFAFAFAQQLAMRVPPELEPTARLIPIALGAGILLWLSTVHDAAAAQLATDGTPRVWRALGRGMRVSTPMLVAIHLAFMVGAPLAYAAGEVASRTLVPSLGFMLSQAFALSAAFVNAAWLSVAMTRTSQPFHTSLE